MPSERSNSAQLPDELVEKGVELAGLTTEYVYAPQIVAEDGFTWEPDKVDWCSSEIRARDLGAIFLSNRRSGRGPNGDRLQILRREVGPWEVVE